MTKKRKKTAPSPDKHTNQLPSFPRSCGCCTRATPWLTSSSRRAAWPPPATRTSWTSSLRASTRGRPWPWAPPTTWRNTSPSARGTPRNEDGAEPLKSASNWTCLLYICFPPSCLSCHMKVQMVSEGPKHWEVCHVSHQQFSCSVVSVWKPNSCMYCTHILHKRCQRSQLCQKKRRKKNMSRWIRLNENQSWISEELPLQHFLKLKCILHTSRTKYRLLMQ